MKLAHNNLIMVSKAIAVSFQTWSRPLEDYIHIDKSKVFLMLFSLHMWLWVFEGVINTGFNQSESQKSPCLSKTARSVGSPSWFQSGLPHGGGGGIAVWITVSHMSSWGYILFITSRVWNGRGRKKEVGWFSFKLSQTQFSLSFFIHHL